LGWLHFVARALAAPDNWVSAVNGDWVDGTKWSLGSSPAGTDDASIPFGGIAVSFNTNASVNSLASSADLTILGGALAGSQANGVTPVTIGGGTLSLDGGGLSSLTLGAGAGAIAVAANGGNFLSNVTLNHDVNLSANGYVQVFGANTNNNSIALAGGANGIQLRDGNALLIVSSSGAIHGSGAVFQTFGGATLQVDGTVTADQSGNTLALNPSNITGGGTLAATGGGVLSIGGLLNGSALKANVDAMPGSRVIVDGGGLSGTLASTTGSGLSFSSNGGNVISAATINGDLTFVGSAYAQVFNANTASGTIHMAGTSNGIQLRDGNALLTIASAGKMQGYGQVFQTFGGATLENKGTISADVAAQTLALNPSNITGSGTFEAKNGGVLSIGGTLTGSNAVVHVDNDPSSAVLVNGGGLAGSFAASTGSGISFSANGNNSISTATIGSDLTFNGGAYAQVYGANSESGTIHMAGTSNGIQLRDGNATLKIVSGGKLQGYGAVFQTFGGATLANQGTIAADSVGKTLALNNSVITNASEVAVSAAATLSVGGSLTQTAGHTAVDGTLSLAQTFALQGGSLTGSGSVIGSVDNSGGSVGPGDSPGLLSITGSYNQQVGGLFDIELGGAVAGLSYDQLDVTGAATLAGSIDVGLVNGFRPNIGDKFDVMLRGSGNGTFANLLTSTPGLAYTVDYEATKVIVTITAVPVPEPSTAALALVGAAGLGAMVARRKLAFA
jgi:fibronectin-binding autotransporter adhesin